MGGISIAYFVLNYSIIQNFCVEYPLEWLQKLL